MYMKKILLTILLCTLVLLGCKGKSDTSDQPDELQISDPARQLEATAGKEFKIILDSNPTTGYHWEIMGALDGNVVEFVSKNYKADGLQMTGSGGTDVWVFKAVAPGEATITLGNYPPDTTAEAEQTITFTVVVK
jgi:predicted secreted protein